MNDSSFKALITLLIIIAVTGICSYFAAVYGTDANTAISKSKCESMGYTWLSREQKCIAAKEIK